MNEEDRAELTVFTSNAYVYIHIPPAASYGHRAELWDVERWFQEVKLRVVTAGDDTYVRLEELESGELFAEAPLPSDGTPLTRCVEPVVDSSRYYVVRVQDRQDAKKHAYLGVGFRERNDSSGFSAALDEYRQYLRRKAEAAAMRAAYEQQVSNGEDDGSGSGEASTAASRYALQAGQTISLKIPGAGKASSSVVSPGTAKRNTGASAVFSLLNDPASGGPRLAPPPPPPAGACLLPVLSGRQASSTGDDGWAAFPAGQPCTTNQGSGLSMRASGELQRPDAHEQASAVDDEWGEFQ